MTETALADGFAPLMQMAKRTLADMEADYLSPDASAQTIRELIAAEPELAPRLIAALVREIEAARAPMTVSHYGEDAAAVARDRFGASARPARAATPKAALDTLGSRNRAVIRLDERDPWWAHLLGRPDLSVIDDGLGLVTRRPDHFVVAPVWSEPSGQDRTWWMTDAQLKPAEIEAELAKLGLVGHVVARASGLMLVGMTGYVQRHDARLAKAPGQLRGVIGAVPIVSMTHG